MIDTEILYNKFKRLVKEDEWLTFEQHIKDIASIHKEQAVIFLSKNKIEDAKRQSWIAEGLMEAIAEPNTVVKDKESISQKVKDYLASIGKK